MLTYADVHKSTNTDAAAGTKVQFLTLTRLAGPRRLTHK
jgi:hypothetical protein